METQIYMDASPLVLTPKTAGFAEKSLFFVYFRRWTEMEWRPRLHRS